MIALVAISIAFVACKKENKDDSGYVIEVKNVQNTSDGINYVEAQLTSKVLDDSKYANGAFKLNLPETVSNDLLKSGSSDGLFGWIDIVALNKQKKTMGEFSYQDGNKNVRAHYAYANNDFKFEYTNEQGTAPQIWNCSFVKGWNVIYAEETENEMRISTTKPSGINLKWYFFSNTESKSQNNTTNFIVGGSIIQNLMIK